MLIQLIKSERPITSADACDGELHCGEYDDWTNGTLPHIRGRVAHVAHPKYRYKAIYRLGAMDIETVFISTDGNIHTQRFLNLSAPRIILIYSKYKYHGSISVVAHTNGCNTALQDSGNSVVSLTHFLKSNHKIMFLALVPTSLLSS